ncbi:MAG: hypothetical protein WA510_32230, partial [Acidobacteriaceae bacterium]
NFFGSKSRSFLANAVGAITETSIAGFYTSPHSVGMTSSKDVHFLLIIEKNLGSPKMTPADSVLCLD